LRDILKPVCYCRQHGPCNKQTDRTDR